MDDERLIMEVEKYKILYDTTDPYYKDNVRKDKAWFLIAGVLGVDACLWQKSILMTSTGSPGNPRYTGHTQASTSKVSMRQKATTTTQKGGVSHTKAPTSKKRPKPQDQEFVRVITTTSKDTIIHNLRIPKGPPPSEILPTREDLTQAEESMKLHKLEATRRCEQSCADAAKIAQKVRQRTLGRAHHLMMEQEYDIRNLNSLIIGAKYDALNEAKMKENKELRDKFIKEEKDLEAMDNLTIKRYWEAIEDRERRQRQFRIDRRMRIVEQIEQNLEVKRRENETKMLEGQHIRQENERRRQQIILDKKRKRVEDRRMHEENMQVNEIIMSKDKRRKEELLADMIHMEHVRRNIEKADRYDEEQRQIRAEKDRLFNESLEQSVKERKLFFKAKKEEEDMEKNWRDYYHMQRTSHVSDHTKNKLDQLKVSGLPEIYYHNVERGSGVGSQNEQRHTNADTIGQARMPRIQKMKTAQCWSYI
ncbi:hypothetical protein JOB18_005959 [Solea senegalensis]|uniref:Cilia- and flagella-associated protein 45 n=1 Tax=Solea senegalensis TaxID=28829 RepID=A0AAV6SXH2_SOLSE|nr:hypothetical protein JOB18_005959 [Solea senegalensis]